MMTRCRVFTDGIRVLGMYTGGSPLSRATAIALQKLGKFAGWSHPSPIGIDLHPRYGPWFAFRAVFLINTPCRQTHMTRVRHRARVVGPNPVNPCVPRRLSKRGLY
ncbi:MAG: hypothetical protein CM1200mP18_16900 [Gammaproteobacteria bacterium]|nr:MAG: hypothetical protein CM1200mP18_16900 [Gammaproteobacteria bacterium]